MSEKNPAQLTIAEIKEFVANLHAEGKSDKQIADYLGLERSQITRLRKAMSLAATWGMTLEAKERTRIENAAIVALHDDWDWAFQKIADALEIKQRVMERYYEHIDAGEQAEKARKKVTKTKKCIFHGCCETFVTSDPTKEWYCEGHREAVASASSFCEEYTLAA